GKGARRQMRRTRGRGLAVESTNADVALDPRGQVAPVDDEWVVVWREDKRIPEGQAIPVARVHEDLQDPWRPRGIEIGAGSAAAARASADASPHDQHRPHQARWYGQ